jgi:hypothetical protein
MNDVNANVDANVIFAAIIRAFTFTPASTLFIVHPTFDRYIWAL